jgi:hypothetical protein
VVAGDEADRVSEMLRAVGSGATNHCQPVGEDEASAIEAATEEHNSQAGRDREALTGQGYQ